MWEPCLRGDGAGVESGGMTSFGTLGFSSSLSSESGSTAKLTLGFWADWVLEDVSHGGSV